MQELATKHPSRFARILIEKLGKLLLETELSTPTSRSTTSFKTPGVPVRDWRAKKYDLDETEIRVRQCKFINSTFFPK